MAKIWKVAPTLEQLNSVGSIELHKFFGIEFTDVGEDYLEARMEVNSHTRQPAGLLHGGASVVLAETLGSFGSALIVGPEIAECVGLEINASHLKGIRKGTVVGRGTPIRVGKTIHVWEIRIRENSDPGSDLVCVCRLTVLIRQKRLLGQAPEYS